MWRGPWPVTSSPLEGHLSGGRPAESDEGLDELVLAVSCDSGDAEDLTRPHLEVDATNHLRPTVVRDVQAAHLQGHVRRMRLATVDGQLNLATDHQLGQVVLVGLRGMRWPTTRPRRMTVIRSAISSTSYSLWLMKTMLRPLGGETAQKDEDLLGLLGRQHRRRLVEDEDARLAIERLEDLHPLLPRRRTGCRLGVRVDLEVEPLGRARGSASGPPAGR